jgi:nicotinate-nucleotide pyrophosphorylase (carboxylating)
MTSEKSPIRETPSISPESLEHACDCARYGFQFDDMEPLPREEIKRAVSIALAEDVGSGDVTTLATVPENTTAIASMVAREPLVVAGIELAEAAFREVSPSVTFKRLVKDGERVGKGSPLLEITGPTRSLLTAERVALNFVQRLSGIATLTAQFVDAIKGTQAKILDTRKTTPGLRLLEKYAVACGGGQNHRIGLYDMVLIKDNHLVALRDEPPSAIEAAVRRARAKFPNLKVEVEADTPEQVQHALLAGADIILLDNMSLDNMRTAVGWVAGKAKTEASGGVNLQTVRGIAETGVDYISVGALTHSARAMDVALDFVESLNRSAF